MCYSAWIGKIVNDKIKKIMMDTKHVVFNINTAFSNARTVTHV